MFSKKKKVSVGLALGGGAVRGFVHLGVLQVLEPAGLKPSFIAGTSAGSLVVIDSGSVGYAVQASCSVPGLFVPVKQGDSLIVDGGVINNLPADIVRDMGADFVIAVDLTADQSEKASPAQNIFEVLITSLMRLMSVTGFPGREAADCLISPDLSEYSYHDMDQFEALVQEGKTAAEKVLPQLRAEGVLES